jgi:cyclophilin family peptidyl-prolyl cis-trans isomerase/HEAT repeat protein
MNPRPYLLTSVLALTVCSAVVNAQPAPPRQRPNTIATTTLLTIIRHEDERRWDDQLQELLTDADPKVRARAALAAGRIGDVKAVPVLSEVLLQDRDNAVREMATFALGEIEAPGAAYALVTALKNRDNPARARVIEALGKVTAAMMTASSPAGEKKPEDDRLDKCKAAIVEALQFELQRPSGRDRLTVLLGLTAVLRIRPDGAGSLVTKFLDDPDPSIIATALNTMARLRLKDANERVGQLLKHTDPIVRANAARVIGAAERKEAFDAVLDHALHDADLRVRVSAIRTLASLKDARAADPLLQRGQDLWKTSKQANDNNGNARSEILEIATTLGRVIPNSNSERTRTWFEQLQEGLDPVPSEIEIAYARVAPQFYASQTILPWQKGSGSKLILAQSQAAVGKGITELASIKTGQALLDVNIKELATKSVSNALTCQRAPGSPHLQRIPKGASVTVIALCTPLETIAVSDFLNAYAALKPPDLEPTLRERINASDVVIRATAAELLGQQAPSEAIARTLIDALPRALRDKDSDDAATAILAALAKQKSTVANEAIKTALDSSNYLIRRRAVALLKTNGVGDFSDRIGTLQTRNTALDYRRAMARSGKQVTATLVTNRGSFTIQFLPEDAPLTVDNFVQLAKRGYFNGQTIPRVVPNFVVQAGDPRGDQNGGPGYQIRCEINEAPFERAAVGMALSGKDTGGSQWFVTHSPQQHLDGGYTVFGRVIRGMDVIDNIARGDVIRRVVVNER